LRITLLLTQDLDSPGGAGRFMPLAQSLVQLGHAVTILALHHDYKCLPVRRFNRDGVDVWYVGQMHVRKPGDRKVYYGPLQLIAVSIMATLRLTWAALRTPSDAIHVCKTQPMNGIAAWVVHVLRRIPVYLDSDDYEAVNNRFGGAWQQRIVAWFEDWMPSFAAGITTNTTFIADRFRQIGHPRLRILVVPNAVDRERFSVLERPDLPAVLSDLRRSLDIDESDRVVVYVGSLSTTSHALDLLLEAFRSVVHHLPNALLLMVGGGEDLDRLERKASDLQIAERTRFTGRIPSAHIPLYYRLGEVSVDPMQDSVPARSSLSLKLLESIVAGVPCVTGDVGDRQRIVGDCGLAVPADDPLALARGILSILENPEKASELRAATVSARDSHLWDHRIHTFTEIYG